MVENVSVFALILVLKNPKLNLLKPAETLKSGTHAVYSVFMHKSEMFSLRVRCVLVCFVCAVWRPAVCQSARCVFRGSC